MTQIELKTMNIICTSFPKVAEELKRIADALELKECCIRGKSFKGYGHDPYPVVKTEGYRCCDECHPKVLKTRIEQTGLMIPPRKEIK